eukprot:8970447-Prorocentrum_lima.AAC.1
MILFVSYAVHLRAKPYMSTSEYDNILEKDAELLPDYVDTFVILREHNRERLKARAKKMRLGETGFMQSDNILERQGTTTTRVLKYFLDYNT